MGEVDVSENGGGKRRGEEQSSVCTTHTIPDMICFHSIPDRFALATMDSVATKLRKASSLLCVKQQHQFIRHLGWYKDRSVVPPAHLEEHSTHAKHRRDDTDHAGVLFPFIFLRAFPDFVWPSRV